MRKTERGEIEEEMNYTAPQGLFQDPGPNPVQWSYKKTVVWSWKYGSAVRSKYCFSEDLTLVPHYSGGCKACKSFPIASAASVRTLGT